MTEESGKEDYEKRLRRRLEILKEEMAAGNIHISSDLKVIDELRAVQYGNDGEIDLNTVKSGVRALALAAEAMHYRKETKKIISLQELQRGYFENIEAIFGSLYNDMKREGATPFQVGSGVARDPEGVRIFHKAIPGVLEWVNGLWTEVHDVAHLHAEDVISLKSVFGGETFPQGNKNIVSSTGIYIDTNILPDPFLRSRYFLDGPDPVAAVRTFITCGLSLLQYKEAALAEIDVPMVAVIPDLLYLDENIRERVFTLAQNDTVSHLSAMFGTPFANLEEAQRTLRKLKTSGDVAEKLANPDLLLFDVDDTGPVEANIDTYIQTFLAPYGHDTHAGGAVISSTTGRMRQANDLLFRSTRLRGSPLIDAPTSWRYFNWKLGYGNTQQDPQTHINLHMTKALQSAASGQMEWLGAVPVQSLIEMRKQGALPELRSMLSAGVRELIDLRPDNFFGQATRLSKTFNKHLTNTAPNFQH